MDRKRYTGTALGVLSGRIARRAGSATVAKPVAIEFAASWSRAFHAAVSFATNTNWQAYSGETTLSPK